MTSPPSPPEQDHASAYAAFRAAVQSAFDDAAAADAVLFRTDAANLFDVYLSHLADRRQIHTCSACRRFVTKYGGLATITPDGQVRPALWDAERVPPFYRDAAQALREAVRKARVTGVFLSSHDVWGRPETNGRSHLALRVAEAARYPKRVQTPQQAMAAKREDFRTVARALAGFKPNALAEALRVLEADAVARSEKFVGPVRWLIAQQDMRSATKDARLRDHLLWKSIASAPEGYCHPRSSVVGTLLEDIAAGLPFDEVKARFNAKMHPLKYQRPQVAPSAGTIAAAERLVEQMGIARSLERRFARLDEIETIWKPSARPAEPPEVGVFGHIKPKGRAGSEGQLDIPPVTMTWEKFTRTALPSAEAMQLNVPAHGNFAALLTAVHADAPPIYKYDREDRRNPVAGYVYHGGSPAAQWGLSPGWTNVTAFALWPNLWGDQPMPHLLQGGILILEGAVDSRDSGLALFPEMLRHELHGVRSAIEAFSRNGRLQGRDEASACGYSVTKQGIGVLIRTLTDGRFTTYSIDRWD